MTYKQTWNAERYVTNASFVSRFGMSLLELLEAKAGERVLDLACGEGSLALELASQGVEVVGVDASPELIAAAQARGVDARVMDAQALPFVAEFDAVFSNAALHWMPQIEAVFAGVARALRPGGRFVAECGGAGNVQILRSALVEELDRRGVNGEARVPWHFRSDAEYGALLTAAGFRVQQVVCFPRPTPLPGDVAAWIATFGQHFTDALPVKERAAYLDDVRARVAPRLKDADGNWTLDYVRVRFVAALP
ncbi:MAG: methyltransferase domain-containing protein [Myxococcales bacterium]